ncbi:unnamed protein product [Ceutorhynchus assimilis]|uniref:BESS domain-containing protein n=1 Tax=Ceutorhynchus assimilis TaxID=467358 RepID=A0A9N9QBE9_9CUCU|nr:unnamed protein product [Ceutorhynchus assimilis]
MDNAKELNIVDPATNINYSLLVDEEDYNRALNDDAFLSMLLTHAKTDDNMKVSEQTELDEDTPASPAMANLETETKDTEVSFILPPRTNKNHDLEELLITEVQIRPPLWDARLPLVERSKPPNPSGKNYDKYPNIDVTCLQKKWKNLKDTYLKTKSTVEAYIPTTSSYADNINKASVPKEPEKEIIPPHPNKRKLPATQKLDSPQKKNLKAIEKISETPEPEEDKINPICLKISTMLEKMPMKERSIAEIELLKKAFDFSQPYL